MKDKTIIAAPQEAASCGSRRCKECGDEFSSSRKSGRLQVFCNSKCKKRFFNKKYYIKVPFVSIIIPCSCCGSPVLVNRANGRRKRYCSKSCRQFEWKKRNGRFAKIRTFQRGTHRHCKYKNEYEATIARKQQQREHYLRNILTFKHRSKEQYKKPERKEAIALYKRLGKGKIEPIVKKLFAIERSIRHKTVSVGLINSISEGRTYEAYL